MWCVFWREEGTNTAWLLVVILHLLVELPTKSAVNPGCECVRYTSTWGKEWGVFMSPDYPSGYPANVRCLLYSFSAPPGFIIHLHLDKVNLPQRQVNYPQHNGCVDYLKMFIHVDEVRSTGSVGVNENTPWTTLLCGSATNLSYHSSSRHFIIQFHSGPNLAPHPQSQELHQYSFSGRYRFLNSSQFTSTGRLMTGTKCDFQFVGSEEEGRFFSPHYPSTYPYNIKCAYFFYASLHKRVRIVFESISLQPGEYSCLNKTDVLRVIDGSNPNSPIIALICNEEKDYEILSSGPHLQVEFLANSDSPGTGFRAKYQYVQVQLDSALDNTRLPPEVLNGQDGLPQASTLVPQCNQVISSDAGRNGSFSSPNYPHHYTPKTECRYLFIGHGRERVQILFTDFSLFHPIEKGGPDAEAEPTSSTGGYNYQTAYGAYPGGESQTLLAVHRYVNEVRINDKKKRKCLTADTLSVWIYSDGQLEKVVTFCGHKLPPPIMSNGHRLTLEFKGASNAHFSRGFHANYAFLEDYGITSGRQLRDYPCGFMYNSTEVSSGTFTSPNYPGIYPRDTECHYFFYGAYDHHVVLTFSYFHIEGIRPCHESTKSDYLEFSNYMPVDTSYGRKCGVGLSTKPFRLISEAHFFRVTFRSNDEFDGGGFFASFHFTAQPKEDLIATHDHSSIRLILPGDEVNLGNGDDELFGKGGGGVTNTRSGGRMTSGPQLLLERLLLLFYFFRLPAQ
ncbi:suppressor of lurcher protein 1 [Folsomia candida]|uniref:suppressor of lurcher protein 1 n=1 Tax=Folsomia candida TaxID=158441 RepID=UPI0016054558|nr:suppressor of lurcher protein 1 [Folsomia candida]